MIKVLLGICLVSIVWLVIMLIKPSFRKKGIIIVSILVFLLSAILIVPVKNYQDKVEDEQKVKEEQAERKKVEAEQKAKEEQEMKEKAEAEQKAKEEQEMKEKAEAEQKVKEEQEIAEAEQKAREEAEQKIKDEESLKMNNINTAKEQLLGKRYFIAPSLYDGVDANKAMTEKKAPQNLMHDGGKGVTFTNENTARIELAGTYRPDMDMNYTLTENTLTIGQDNIPYSINDGIVSFGTWTTDWGGHTVTWSITKNS